MFYLDLFKSLEQHHVRYLLVGGLAMNLHGVPRMTMDVDLLLALNAENLKDFLKVAQELHLKPSLPVTLDDFANPVKRDEWVKQGNMVAFSLCGSERNIPTVDILIGAKLEFDSAYSRCVTRHLSGVNVSLASLEDMLTMKSLAGRKQDLADIEHIKKLLGAGRDEG